jgi:flagellar biosynthesis protein FlhF
MQTKTYFASSVPAALEVARRELGAEAMLLNSRPAPAESRAFGRLEVTFAFDARSRPEPPARVPEAAAAPPSAGRGPEAFAVLGNLRQARPARSEATQLDDLRRQIEALRAAVEGNPGEPAIGGGQEHEEVRGRGLSRNSGPAAALLTRNGVSPRLAREVAEAAALRPGDLSGALVEELIARFPVAPFVPLSNGESRAMAFVGPAGRGKTTTLVKVAVNFGLAHRIPVRIYQAGSHGVGCQEQMARYASILGVPFFACESLESLSLSLNGDGWKGLVLIDTPGISASSRSELEMLGSFLARRADLQRHLVLRSDARSADIAHMVSRFSPVSPTHLLFTGTEETLTTGAMVEAILTTGLACTFAGTGPSVPDDLEELDIPRLARSVCVDGFAPRHKAAVAG